MKLIKSAVAATAVALAATSLSTAVMAEEKILLKTPVAFPSSLPALGSPIINISETINMLGGGTLKMKFYEPKKLVATSEILDAVSTGKVNAGYTTAGYHAGKMPASPIFSAVPFGPEAGEYLAWLLYGNGGDLYQEMYDTNGYNVHVVPCAIISPETSGWFANEINSPADLEGLNMRFFGLGAKVMNKLGVSTVGLPAGEIFGALEKGAIDATEFSQPAIDQRLGLHKIVKFNYFPGWHQQATLFELLVNGDAWNSMSERQQTVINTACRASLTNSFAEGESAQFAVMAKAEENGVQIRYWSDDMLNTFSDTWDEVATEFAAEDEFFAKVWADLSEFRAGYDLWEANAFLPRAAR